VDTSAWYAYVNRVDPDHAGVAGFLENFSGQLVTSNYIFDELITLVRTRLGYSEALRVGAVLRNADIVHLERVTSADEEAAWRLFQDRSDKTYSFTDCTSFVLMRRLALAHTLATDEHFRQEGFVVYP
jgi:hypothetical protein